MPYRQMKSDFEHPAVAGLVQGMAQGARLGNEALLLVKNSLNGGELAPGMGARFDQPRYQSGCHKLLNMTPLPCGGICKRPGFEHIAMAAGARGRLAPFIFSQSQSRLLEFFVNEAGTVSMKVWSPQAKALFTLNLPWKGEWLDEVNFCQSADVIFYAHPKMRPGRIARHADNDWRHETLKWKPDTAPPKLLGYSLVGHTDSDDLHRTTYRYVATAINEGGEESEASEVVLVERAGNLTQSYYPRLRFECEADNVEIRVYKLSAGVYGFIGSISEPDEDGEWIFEDRNISPDTEDTPPVAKDPFTGEGEYPSVVFLHQQRLGYAASDKHPLTMWLSQAGNFKSMASSVPPDDDDAIEATLAAKQANRILWAESDRNGLAFGTEGGEWILKASEGQALSPRDLSFEPQTYYGSENGLPALRAGSSILFAQRGACVARELGYSFQDDRYNASDLSLLARHILRDNPIRHWCWQPEPYGIIWCALKNGQLAGLTYMREHDVIAWHRHETAGFIHSLASIPSENGHWQLWALVSRNVSRETSGAEKNVSQETSDSENVSRETLTQEAGAAENVSQETSTRETSAPSLRLERMAPFYEGEEALGASHVDGLERHEFAARCIPCLAESNLDNGGTLMRVRKINAVKARVIYSKPFKARVLGRGITPSPLMDVPARGGAPVEEDDWSCPLGAGFRDGARLELVMDGPAPVTLLGLTITMEIASHAAGQGLPVK